MHCLGFLASSLLGAAAVVEAYPSSSTPGYIRGVGKFTGSRCSAPKPPTHLVNDAKSLYKTAALRTTADSMTVKTYVHVVTTEASKNDFTQQMIDDQMSEMNDAYNPVSISYKLVNTSFTVNDDWAAANTGDVELAMKTALRRGTYADLNLYFLSDLGDGLLGYCYFPDPLDGTGFNGNKTEVLDGCVHLAGSLPGGQVADYNEGKTAVHETGHWHGLFHVFQGSSCDEPGDYVDDTPAQMNATSGCPSSANSCPSVAGLDSIHNYMDYSDDACMTGFTSGQKQRMFESFQKYRAGN